MEGGSGFIERKKYILDVERRQFIGGRHNLSEKEIRANEIILREKRFELNAAYKDPDGFLPVKHFFMAKQHIDKSKVFGIIRKLPKGASLHTHFLAGVDTGFIIKNITYERNIHGRIWNDIFKLKFISNPSFEWKSLEQYRREDANFDIWLKQQLDLEAENPAVVYPNAGMVWERLKKTFSTKYDMVSYKPIFKTYIHQFLKELYLDNVMYAEIKGTIQKLYDLDGNECSNVDFFKMFMESINEFKKDHPKFIGARYIHSIYRGVTTEVMKASLKEIVEMKQLFPDFIAGFDFVGHEEEGNSIEYYRDSIQEATKHLKFFVHAGESNWYGHTDLNMIDAALLNASRIGHAFGLSKHPLLAEMIKEGNIAIELCPISNQILMLNQDPRNHPVIPLLARDFPVVICNDDPSLWGAAGLSYDWYVVFMAMTPEGAGLEVLKQFAINSIRYSAMEDGLKKEAFEKWEKYWDEFLDDIILSDSESM
ncbi:unnamed protein product [Callosobruchus maculatus]|uniref:Adenosine deaminase n=1 Tax=Callosobruchus maculatus TaxID=64391 RepID=A0A653C5S9_CALMS|nr:unnamed protein product [Callosobruchus maculatus]